MTWYWLMYISLFIFVFLEQFGNLSKRQAKYICSFYTVLWIFLSAIRWNGTLGDWEGYYQVFKWSEVNSFLDVFKVPYWFFEPIYYLALRFINYLTGSYSILLLFMAVIAIGGFYRGSKYLNTGRDIEGQTYGMEKSSYISTFFIFWCTSCAGIYTVRTNMANAICVISIRAIEEKKIWKFVILVLLATMFHFSAIVFLISYPIYHYHLNFKKLITLAFIIISVRFIGVGRIISIIVNLLGGRYVDKESSYLESGIIDYSYMSVSGVVLLAKAFGNTIFILLIILFLHKYIKKNKRFNGLINLYIIGAALQVVLLTYNFELARISIFFISMQYFILPYIFNVFKGKGRERALVFMGLSLYMGVKLYALITSAEGYATFNTIFSP